MRDEKIVVGYDGSPGAHKAARWALDEAARTGAAVELMYAYEWPSYLPAAAMMPAPAVYPDSDTDHAVAEMIGRALINAGISHPGVPLSARVEHGAPASALVRRCGDATLLVLGGPRRTGLRMLLGSVGASVSAYARCPVVVVRGEPRATDPVVAGVDDGPAAPLVLGFAFEQARLRGVAVRAVHGWRPPDTGRDLLSETNLRAVAEQRARLERALAGWRARFPHVPAQAEVIVGAPGEVLAQAAAGAQLVVAGARPRSPLRGMLRPSVGRGLLRHARCSVALVHGARAVTWQE